MKLRQQADLSTLNTFGVPARAGFLFEVEREEDLLELPGFRPERDLVLGQGSNILLLDDVRGTVLLNRIRGIERLDQSDDQVLVEVGAGENWHALVEHAVARGWHGLENLALIPGLAGAAPVQNIGAYGVELAEVLESVTAWDWQEARWVVFQAPDCRLGYRDSIFKQQPRDRWFITSIRLRLCTRFTPRLEYTGLKEELGCVSPTAEEVFAAVVALRRRKLPDPAQAGNAGSFFKNPVLDAAAASTLLNSHPDLPHWPQADGGTKFSAAAMIQACGLKGHQAGAAAVSNQHALVLVNRGGATGRDLWHLAQLVRERVAGRFGIELEPEPRIFANSQEST